MIKPAVLTGLESKSEDLSHEMARAHDELNTSEYASPCNAANIARRIVSLYDAREIVERQITLIKTAIKQIEQGITE